MRSPEKLMKGKIFLFLFALPFFCVGVWMSFSIGGSFMDAWGMRDWVPIEATLTNAGYSTHSGDDSDTYEAYAEYNYIYDGQRYFGSRVAVASGADNIGDYQQDTGRTLSQAWSSGRPITVFVNPDNPAEAIYDRSLRWGLLGFQSIFLVVFGGVGLGLMIYAFRAPAEKDPEDLRFAGKPWLANDAWQGDAIRSNSKAAMFFTWGFAAFWNLVSAPLPFVLYEEIVDKQNWPALLGLLFPLVGAGLLVWAVRRTLEWRRFGLAPVALDPFPGSIGGHVGGTIDVNLSYDPNARFSVTLTNLKSYVSGSGKNRSRKESAEWQDSQVAQVASGPRGTRLSFRFDVPVNLEPSDATRSGSTYHLWRLNLTAALPGTDFDRVYEIPVYPTGEQSRRLSGISVKAAQSEQLAIDLEAIRKVVRLSQGIEGKSLLFPAGRNLGGGFGALLFGCLFTGVGWFLMTHEGHPFMGAIFGIIGVVVAAAAFYTVLNSLEVRKQGSSIVSIRRLLGFTVKRTEMPVASFARFKMKSSYKTQSGNSHTVYYSLQAVDNSGNMMTVGEGFKGASQVRAAEELLAREFGLAAREPTRATEFEPGNLLIG